MAPPQDDATPTSTAQRQRFWGLAAGPIAGVCSRFVVYPFDTIKARLQVQRHSAAGHVQYRGTADALFKIVRHDGPQGLYRGFLAVALGSIPANMAYFGGYELGKALIPGGYGMAGDMAVGAVAQLVAGVVFTPVDVIKERMQVQGVWGVALSYRGPLQAVGELLRARGPMGLMKGYWATNAVWIPWNMLFIAWYEQAKRLAAGLSSQPNQHPQVTSASPSEHPEAVQSHQRQQRGASSSQAGSADLQRSDNNSGLAARGSQPDNSSTEAGTSHHTTATQPGDDLPPWTLALCSAGAASLAGLVTHPMDVVKTRLQVQPVAASGVPPASAHQVALELYRQEGLKAFSRGALARILVLAPGAALSWAIYEPVKRVLSGG